MSDTLKVSVTSKKFHSLHGEEHAEGEVYDVDADQVDNLVAQGMVTAPDAPPPAPRESQPVEPMTTLAPPVE